MLKRTEMTPDDFDKYMSGVQHMVTAIGIMVAGGWVLFTFWGQHVIQKANLDVATAETQIKKLEQEAFQQPVLSVTISPGAIAGDSELSSITAQFRNDGKLALRYEDVVLVVKQIYDESGNAQNSGKPITITAQTLNDQNEFTEFSPRVLRSGQERSSAFILPKLSRGVYFVELKVKYSGMDIIDGRFINTAGDAIYAVEQTSISIPLKPVLKEQ
jgi:hypothetical protein